MSAIASEIENLRVDRDQWRELARLEAEAARKAEARALAAEAALAAERERCAKIAENPEHTLDWRARAAIAAAIRAQE